VEAIAVQRRFGDVTALSEVSLTVAPGEFVTLLGPSGCGKTTLLRIIAGFDQPTAGSLRLNGRDVTKVPAHRRPVNMVFQRPALFPHLDVASNVAFGPRIAGIGKAELRTRVDDALAMVRLDGFQRRRAHELSGGQMQRVALARAIVNRPEVLLLDEPLSALDLRIRLEMEEELRRLHRELGATFVYVTHDQREALALSDRIAVFSGGRIEQIGTPDEVYNRPATPFVARLVGDANVIAVDAAPGESNSSVIRLGDVSVLVNGKVRGPAWLVVRPENVQLGLPGVAEALIGTIVDVSFRGTGFAYRVDIAGLPHPLKSEVPGGPPLAVGERVSVAWLPSAVCLLERDDQHHAGKIGLNQQ